MFAFFKRGPSPSSSAGSSSTVSSRGLKRLLLVNKSMSVTVIPSAFKKNQLPLVSSPRRQASAVPKRDPFVFPLNTTVRNPRVPVPKPRRLPVSKTRISGPIRLAKTAQKSCPAVSRIPKPSRGTVHSADIPVPKVKSLKEFSLRSKIPIAISPRPGFASPPSQSTHLKMRATDPFAASPAVGCTTHWPPRSPRRPRAVPSVTVRSRYNQKLISEEQTPCPSQTLVVEARHKARKVSAAATNSSGSCVGKEGRVLCTKETAVDTVVPLTMQASDLVCSGSVMQTVFHLLLDGIEDEAPEPGLLLLGPAENAGDLNGSDSDATAVSSSGNSDSVFGRTAPPDSCTITKTETKTRTKKPKAKESSTRTSMGGLVGKLRKRLSRKHTSSVPKTSSFVLVEQSGCACSASKDNDKPCEVHQVLARHYEVVTGAFYQFDTRLPPPALQPPVAAKNAPECALPTKTSTQTRPARTSRGIRRVCGMVIPSLTQGPGRPTEKEV